MQNATLPHDPDAHDGAPLISVIVPARDEEASVPALSVEIESALDAAGLTWECIWVDDGSRDGTLEHLKHLHRHRREHQYLSFDRDYGQSAALAAGFRASRGAIIATLDADLQNDPRDLPRLVEILRRGDAHMVNGIRAHRHDRRVRRLSSRIANGFRNWMTRERVSDVGCSLRVFYRECVAEVPLFRGMHRFLPTLVRIGGYRIAEVPVAHRSRHFGSAKYGISNRLWVGIADTFGVRWLQRRNVRPTVRCSSRDTRGGHSDGGASRDRTASDAGVPVESGHHPH